MIFLWFSSSSFNIDHLKPPCRTLLLMIFVISHLISELLSTIYMQILPKSLCLSWTLVLHSQVCYTYITSSLMTLLRYLIYICTAAYHKLNSRSSSLNLSFLIPGASSSQQMMVQIQSPTQNASRSSLNPFSLRPHITPSVSHAHLTANSWVYPTQTALVIEI